MAEHNIKGIRLLTKKEVAEHLRCSIRTVERRIKRGLIRPTDGTGGKYGRPLFDPKSIPAIRKYLSL